MGEAKKKNAALRDWRASLTAEEVILSEVALQTHRNFVLPFRCSGMCYRLAFFISVYMQTYRGVAAQPIVGYVNDGLGDIMTSHAWVILNGKKTDISLTITEHPDSVPTGGLLLLDREFSQGAVSYTYHLERTKEALAELENLKQFEEYRELVSRKEAEHAFMTNLIGDVAAQRQYLDSAPDGKTFERMRAIVGLPL